EQSGQAGRQAAECARAWQDFSSVLYLVEARVGAALVPVSVAEEHIRDNRIRSISIAEPWAVRNLHLVTKREPAQPELIREFADILLHDPQVAAARGLAPALPS
ncbi:MAG: LysR substrate-binding domain-containing protein, partial [Pollutimonas bauzanensis]